MFSLALIAGSIISPLPGYHLVYGDEFSSRGLPSNNTWNFEKGFVRNSEKQCFATDRLANSYIREGTLTLQARRDFWGGNEYSSASLTTENRFEFKYGYIEVRAKCPTGRGIWPSVFLLGKNVKEVGWPRCGQVDILENVGFDPNRLHFNFHCEAFNRFLGTSKGANVEVPNLPQEFHVYGLEWTEKSLHWYLDGVEMLSFDKDSDSSQRWPFNEPSYLLVSLAVGGNWGGAKGIDEAAFPAKFELDYVRIFQKK